MRLAIEMSLTLLNFAFSTLPDSRLPARLPMTCNGVTIVSQDLSLSEEEAGIQLKDEVSRKYHDALSNGALPSPNIGRLDITGSLKALLASRTVASARSIIQMAGFNYIDPRAAGFNNYQGREIVFAKKIAKAGLGYTSSVITLNVSQDNDDRVCGVSVVLISNAP